MQPLDRTGRTGSTSLVAEAVIGGLELRSTAGRVRAAAGVARFRAILLTSLTTFAGLLPLMFEQSTQAQFLIPMAVSLGFGILFATFIILLLVPIAYLVLEDVKQVATHTGGARRRGAAHQS